jgi:nucleoside phosphorylase
MAERLDVLIVTAVKDEWEAVRKVDAANGAWALRTASTGLEMAVRSFSVTGGALRFGVTQALGMGGPEAVIAVAQLIPEHSVRCLAMCGVCAGRRGESELGDVIIADRLWQYDTGSREARADGPHEQGDIEMYRIAPPEWKQAAERFEIDQTAAWLGLRPQTYEAQGNWILERRLKDVDPTSEPDAETRCANFDKTLERLWRMGFLESGTLDLTETGKKHIQKVLLVNGKKLPRPKTLKALVGPIASGNRLMKDSEIFARLSETVRKVLGVEMEAAAVGALGHARRLPFLVVMKAVMDHADEDKSDNFKPFAARASAECLVAFLRQNLPPVQEPTTPRPPPVPEEPTPQQPQTRDAVRRAVLEELIRAVATREDALSVAAELPALARPGLPRFHATTPEAYWRALFEAMDPSLMPQWFDVLLANAVRIFPGNRAFELHAPAPEPQPKQVVTITLELQEEDDDPEVAALCKLASDLATARHHRKVKVLVTKGSTRMHLSFEGMSREEADAIMGELQRTLPASVRAQARVFHEDHTFHDYYMDPLYAEGPDGQRFELDHVRASTRVGDIAQGVMGEYSDAFWPTDKKGHQAPPTVDVRHPSGEVQRLHSDQTLHDAGVRPHDTLSVFPERRAGSVNPFLRAESLTVVRNQILDFATSHPGFEVAANSQDIPTEYLFRFRAPGYAPGSPPRLIDRHEVLLVTPPEFPVKAPQAYWQHDIFHPNVHAATGLVCLGVLADSYKPGLHFGTVCQMLIDMASYRNYALDEGYNQEAARWALSDEGQRAILAIGGRSREEVLSLPEEITGVSARPARKVSLRKVGP